MKHIRTGLRALIAFVLVAAGIFAFYQWANAESATTAAWQTLHTVADYEAPTSTNVVVKSTQQLQAIMGTMSDMYGTNVGVVVTDLSNSASAGTNTDAQFVSASIYKLFVAYDTYKKIDAGTVHYTDTLTAYGTSRTVEQCLGDMLTVSDNTCGIALGKLCGWAQLDTTLAAEGYTRTVLNNYNAAGVIIKDKLTSAHDVAALLGKLYDGTLLSKNASTKFLQLLKGDDIDYMLPSGLPAGTVVAHKVGFLGQYQHDAGIIYGTKKNMLVVMLTKGWTTTPEAAATTAFTTLGQAVWNYME